MQLASALAATRDTLATHRMVTLPEAYHSPNPGVLSNLIHFRWLTGAVGYGVTVPVSGTFRVESGIQLTVGIKVF